MKRCPACDERVETYAPGVSYTRVDGLDWHIGCAPPEVDVNEIFLLQLTRSELELLLAHTSTVYAVNLSAELTPSARVLCPEGEVVPLPDFLSSLGAKSLIRQTRKFIAEQGLDGLKILSNKFLQILGRPQL